MRARTPRLAGAFLAALVGVSVGLGGSATAAPQTGGSRMAADLLSQLRTHALASASSYDRSAFLTDWAEQGGCNTRDDVLRRDLYQLVINADGCRVMSGTETDPYTGNVLHYVRGHSTVDIDHVVALGDAWVTGASTWPASERKAFANDPLNLLAVSRHANRVKGDGDASEWLPRVSYDCAYVARQVAVKAKYALWVTAAERSSMRAVLARCPTQHTPTAGASAFASTKPTTKPTTKPATKPTSAARMGGPYVSGCTPSYPDFCIPYKPGNAYNCSDIPRTGFRDAGPDPYRFDGDGDGIACEG